MNSVGPYKGPKVEGGDEPTIKRRRGGGGGELEEAPWKRRGGGEQGSFRGRPPPLVRKPRFRFESRRATCPNVTPFTTGRKVFLTS